MSGADAVVTDPAGIGALVAALRREGRTVVGPTVRDGAIVYDEIASDDDLPAGWTDVHAPGRYRLERRDDGALFGYAVGPHSWKRYLFPPRVKLWEASRMTTGPHSRPDGTAAEDPGTRTEPDPTGHLAVDSRHDPAPRFAFVGVRGCDVAAIAIQDRVFLRDQVTDTTYALRRADLFVVGVNCSTPAATCFCDSMGTGPTVGGGADLVVTELLGTSGTDGTAHDLLVEARTDAGRALLPVAGGRPPTAADHDAAAAQAADARAAMGRRLDTDGIRDLLVGSPEHPRWDDVASRCLACANCTMVCPTCFCSEVEDTTDLTGEHAQRWRRWDSCFTLSFSHTAGGSVRTSTRARYRQWLTHKLATWIDQFDSSGCVGCGRCITWCPVGIDITEEVAAIRATAAEEGA